MKPTGNPKVSSAVRPAGPRGRRRASFATRALARAAPHPPTTTISKRAASAPSCAPSASRSWCACSLLEMSIDLIRDVEHLCLRCQPWPASVRQVRWAVCASHCATARPADRRRPGLRHGPLQLPLPVLHARGGPALAGAGRHPAFEEIARLVELLAAWACRGAAHRRRAARAEGLPAAGGMLARPGRARPRHDDQRLPARARRRRARRRGRRAASTSRSTRSSATASSS